MPPGAVRHPNRRVDPAESTTSVVAKTRYAGTREVVSISTRTSGHGGVAHDSAQPQNRKAGSPDNPNTRLSTTTIDSTVQVTRPVRARDDCDTVGAGSISRLVSRPGQRA